MYKRTIESSRKIADGAMKFLAGRVKADGEGVLVFNPTGATRSGMVGENQVNDLPAYGYRFVKTADLHKPGGATVAADGSTIENDDFRVKFDASRGVVMSVFDKKAKRESIASDGSGNRLEVHWEEPNGMSAWTIGGIKKIEALVGPVEVSVSERGIAWERKFQSTTIKQSITLPPKGPPEFAMSTEWKELGAGDKLCPFLKVAFDVNVGGGDVKFTSQIPFGTIERPINNVEVPAGKWAELAGSAGGAAIINDCKHGYSAEKNTLRLVADPLELLARSASERSPAIGEVGFSSARRRLAEGEHHSGGRSVQSSASVDAGACKCRAACCPRRDRCCR
jgi:alpha-mannosidase